MNEILSQITQKDVLSFLDFYGQKDKLSDVEREQFLKICILNNLNPFNREIHISSYGKNEFRQFAIIIGYEVYIRRAERTGLLVGWGVECRHCKTAQTDIKGNITFIDDLESVITIKRKDFAEPYQHSVKFSEYVQKTKDGNVTKFWLKAESQLKKVAISQGFRLCFSEELKNLPHSNIEAEQTSYTEINEVKKEPESVQLNLSEKKELIKLDLDSPVFKDMIAFLKESKDVNEVEKRMQQIKKKYLVSEQDESDIYTMLEVVS